MFCKYCGTKLNDDDKVCPNCGKEIEEIKEKDDSEKEVEETEKIKVDEEKLFSDEDIYDKKRFSIEPTFESHQPEEPIDTGSFWYGVLGFFFPVIGFILFLVWRRDKPVSSKHAGIGTLIGFIIWVIFIICIICCCSMVDWDEVNRQINEGNTSLAYIYHA